MKCWIFICCLFFFLGSGITQEVRNPTIPQHGKWFFNPHIEWETVSVGSDILVDISAIRINKQGNIFVMNSKINDEINSNIHYIYPK